MATSLKQIQSQRQKLAPRQVLKARVLQLSTVNLEQTILEELEQNPLLEQVDSELEIEDEVDEEVGINDIDVSLEDMYSDESTYYFTEQKKEMPVPQRHTLLESMINQFGSMQYAENLMIKISNEAIKELDIFSESDAKKSLILLVKYNLERTK